MRGFPAPWAIAGGWAIDLFLGRLTRPHADIDVAVFRTDQRALRRQLTGWRLKKVVDGELRDWAANERLALPVHEIHGESGTSTLEFLLNERDGEDWVYRREPTVRCPARHLIQLSPVGLPILCPAVVLLHKSREPSKADSADFKAAASHLPPERRDWLRSALQRCEPDHPWLARLAKKA
jgi:hypothetical protein